MTNVDQYHQPTDIALVFVFHYNVYIHWHYVVVIHLTVHLIVRIIQFKLIIRPFTIFFIISISSSTDNLHFCCSTITCIQMTETQILSDLLKLTLFIRSLLFIRILLLLLLFTLIHLNVYYNPLFRHCEVLENIHLR